MPIVLNGSTGITANNLGVETIVDTAGTGAPSVPNGFEQMFVLPVGTLMWFTGTAAPGGYLVADGSLHSRAAYPDLWSWIVTSGNLAVSDDVWTDGQYSPGDGSTTFRVPKVDDRFIRGKSGTRTVGLVEEDAFQGHWHEALYPEGSGTISSRYYSVQAPATVQNLPTGSLAIPLIQDATTDGVNGTPRTANETRPKALTMLPCIKAFDSVIEPSVLNAAEMVSTINGKLDKDQNIVLGTSVAASGTAVDFVGIPAGVKRITVMFDGVSTNGTSFLLIRIGDSTFESSGYVSTGVNITSTNGTVQNTSGFAIGASTSSTMVFHGFASLIRNTNDFWGYNGFFARADSTVSAIGYGSKSLLGPLDRIRITTENGTDQFDAGTINISWEF